MANITTLVNFTGTLGSLPASNLIADAAGDIFGTTTFSGPSSNYGSLFEIPKTAGGYASAPVTLALISTGFDPKGGLAADAAGNLFGTTNRGGPNNVGTVYEIAKTPAGYASAPTSLASFNGANGANPQAGLLTDAAGDLFGTTNIGGANNVGTVFEIAKAPGGYGALTTLASFGSTALHPQGALIADAAGDLFGTTEGGGPTGAGGPGTVFEIAKTATGYASKPTILVSFSGPDGYGPVGSLIADAAGDLFGTTSSHGASGGGTVFEIAKTAMGYASKPTVLANFSGLNGQNPFGSLIADAAGNLFGTTSAGGANSDGTVFEIAKTPGGYGALTTLVSFNFANGEQPQGGLTADAAGNLFGTTAAGGATGSAGTVFEITGSGFQTPSTLASGLAVVDMTTNGTVAAVGQPYTGPVSGLANEYINVTSDSLNIGVSTPNWFLHSGGGNDALTVSSGTNVLDGGTGSNFLTGGSGTDTFFVDNRGATADIWSTVNNFHSGDAATILGVSPGDFTLSWVDGQGATGYTGLTLHATAAGAPTASLTLAGFTSADLANGRLTVSYGTTAASGGVAGTNYMYVHAT